MRTSGRLSWMCDFTTPVVTWPVSGFFEFKSYMRDTHMNYFDVEGGKFISERVADCL